MSDLIWKLRQWVKKFLPIVVIAAISYGGYSLYKKGTFRHGLGSTLSTLAQKIPFFGSRFRHSGASSTVAYSRGYSPARSRHSVRSRKGRKSSGRHHRRGHAHRRHR